MTDHARRFHDLHQQGTFVLPNAWDAASAAVIAAAGAAAVATSSSGMSWSLGVPDGENLRREDAVAAVARIARVVNVPVSADVESGYGPSPADVAATIDAVIDAGAVGVNLEDSPGHDGEPLRPIGEQCERIAAARAAADRSGAPFVINARTDVFLASVGEPAEREDMAIERGERYAEAGGDCLFVPGVIDPEVIARLVAAQPAAAEHAARAPAAGRTRASWRSSASAGSAPAARSLASPTGRRSAPREELLAGDRPRRCGRDPARGAGGAAHQASSFSARLVNTPNSSAHRSICSA